VKAVSVQRKDGSRLTLGYVRDEVANPAMPFPSIAAQIAGRARVPLNRHGVVEADTNGFSLLQNEPVDDAPELSEEQIETLRAEQQKSWFITAIAVAIAAVTASSYLVIQLFV
jgi:hypothetical protein